MHISEYVCETFLEKLTFLKYWETFENYCSLIFLEKLFHSYFSAIY